MTETKCRSCGNAALEEILSLGSSPLANALLSSADLLRPEATYPLVLVFCPACTLVQITETIPPEVLFKNYFYFSSFSDTVLESARALSLRLIDRLALNSQSLIVEIASNDGYLLKNYRNAGIPVLGIEPARNIAEIAEKAGIPTVPEFFNAALAERLRSENKLADIIHAHNVVAHVADLHGVVEGMSKLLKPDGVAIIENHYIKDLIDHTEFDSIYHEHLCYYSTTSFERLFRQHNMTLVDVERIPLHGGSLRVFFQRSDGPKSLERNGGLERVQQMLAEEKAWGVADFGFYKNFAGKIGRLRTELLSLLHKLKSEKKHVAVYGASAKSTTLLNYFGIGKETLEYVVDRSTAKQGHFTPGTHLPIYAPDKLLETKPEYVLLLTWNFVDEIVKQQHAYRALGGTFIVPIPEVKMIQV